MAMGDSDLALAMAIADNSSSSQDDDFQLSSHAAQLFILNKLTVSHHSKRRKKDRFSNLESPAQKPEKAGKENHNPNKRRDGSKGPTRSSTNPDLSQFRRPLKTCRKNERSIVSSEFTTKKECRKQEVKDESPGESLRKLANKKLEPTGKVASRSSKDSPEKLFKQASITLASSHSAAVDHVCTSTTGPLVLECCKQDNRTLTGSQSLAVDGVCAVSPSRPSSHEHHLKQGYEILTVSPSLAMDDACIISPKPSLHEHPLIKQACTTLTREHLSAGDDSHIRSLRISSCEHHLEHAHGTITDSHSLALRDAYISASSCPSNEHHHKQANLTLTGSHSTCIDSLMPSLHHHKQANLILGSNSTCIDSLMPSIYEHYKQADETLRGSPKLSADEDTFETFRNTPRFSKYDSLHLSAEAYDWQQEEAAQTNRLSPTLSQISVQEYPAYKDDDLLPNNTDCCDATFSSLKPMGETVSLAEEDDLVSDAIEQKQQPLEPECYLTGKLLAVDRLPSANINPESQFSALLQLCVDAASDNNEEEEPKEESLSDHFNVEEGCSKEEEIITSLLTQTRFKNRVGSHNLYLLHNKENSSKLKVSLNSHADNEATVLVNASHAIFLEAQKPSFDAQNEPVSIQCEGAMIYNAGIQSRTEPDLEQPGSALECPVCGSCITNLSLEQREVHTNACLDSMDAGEAHATTGFANVDNNQVSKGEPSECVQENYSLDLTPVLKWLETLNLSRYASIFVREEIDLDTLKCLTDEDLNTLGITALGPRRKILHAITQLEKGFGEDSRNTVHQEAESNQQVELDTSGKKLITDFFELPPSLQRKCPPCPLAETCSKTKGSGTAVLAARKRILTELGGIPEWMSIPGTKFCVDAFQHLRTDCTHWFLTHFHTDHYQGLTRGFRYGLVYCSSITAQLVNTRIGVPWERLKSLPLNQRIDIDGVKVTLIDANHCPGSVMILFEPQNGKAVLHTGDFRFCEAMANSSVLQACNIHTLMLDTTYCNPQYDFPKQEVVIQFIIDAIQAEAFNPSTLFLIGTYTIGKERIFFEIAKVLQKRIYCCATKLRLLQCMKFPDEDMKWLTSDDRDSHIHVVPLWSIASFKRMSYISRRNHGRYNSIVSFSPTGWSFGRGKKRTPGRRWQQGTIVRYEVPYSEHCSFRELREFVRFINPVDIVPSVNNDSPEAADALIALLLNEEDN